jgi:class 3 adenylate cyclase
MAHVLVVEPDLGLRNWCRMHLSTAGHEVATADDARRALKVTTDRAPDVVIIDTELPGATAFALAANLRAGTRTAGVPIVFIVPPGDGAAIAQAAAIAPGRILSKPMSRAAGAPGPGPGVETPASTSQPAAPQGALRAPARQQLSLESKQASVLVVTLRNLVSLARSLPARSLDPLLQHFLTEAREAVTGQGGWVIRIDANGLTALFENSPHAGRGHAALATEAALRVVAAARRAKRWAASTLAEPFTPDLSVGCGVHAGEVLVARLAFSGLLLPSIAGQTADLALRLNGRAKGLGWSVAVTEDAARLSGARFEFGRSATLTDTDHDVTVPVLEVIGLSPGAALPGELADMAEIREAVLANTVVARLAGDADPQSADRTIVIRAVERAALERVLPHVPGHRIARRVGQGSLVTTYQAVHADTGREEALKTLPVAPHDPVFVEDWLRQYQRLAAIQNRNVTRVIDTGRTPEDAWVATEWIAGEPLADLVRRRLPVGRAVELTQQILGALRAVHGIGQWHGALRAEHFRIVDGRGAVLIDFDVTRRLEQVPAELRDAAAATADAAASAADAAIAAAAETAPAPESPIETSAGAETIAAALAANGGIEPDAAAPRRSGWTPVIVPLARAANHDSASAEAPVAGTESSVEAGAVPFRGPAWRVSYVDDGARVAADQAGGADPGEPAGDAPSPRGGAPTSDPGPVAPNPAFDAGVRADLVSTGTLLLAMLAADHARVEAALRFELADPKRESELPIQLASMQPLLDRLLGVGAEPPLASAAEALAELETVQGLWSRPLFPER